MNIEVDENTGFKELNFKIRDSKEKHIILNGCMGQRYIATGECEKKIEIYGTPGNALGAYLNGGEVYVHGNGQDAVGDTMNSGKIIIYGNVGDAVGYAMRGGKIYIEGNTGYRAGIHMKAFMDSKPVLVIGGRAGSFLGEYQAGGIIAVLGKNCDGMPVVHNFCGTGMHGGTIYLRCNTLPHTIPKQVHIEKRRGCEIEELKEVVEDYCSYFEEFDAKEILAENFFVLSPDAANPYKKMYTDN